MTVKTALLLFIFGLLRFCNGRTLLPPILNPQCPPGANCSTYNLPEDDTHSANNLVYFQSTGSNDTLHFLISSINGFSILMIQTETNGQLNVDWTDYLNDKAPSPKIAVNGTVYTSLGVAINQLYRYYDKDDDAKITSIDSSFITDIPLLNLLWNNASAYTANDSVIFTTDNETVDPNYLGDDGTLQISYQIFGSDGRYNTLPHLTHTETSSQLELLLSNLFQLPNNTRYALELVVAASKNSKAQNDVTVNADRSIDDEYTPGTFDTYHISMDNDNGRNTYLLWKPVCYKDASRSLQSSTSVTNNNPVPFQNAAGGLIDAFYGPDSYVAHAFNLSFGINGDNFYEGYTVWTLEIGAGSVPVEKFSALVIALLVVCASVPGIGLIGGGTYGVYSRFIKKQPATKSGDEKEVIDDHENTETTDSNTNNVRF